MVTKYIECKVDVDLKEFNTDELMDELEERGYSVQTKDEVTDLENQILSLKEDFILWKDLGMKNEIFEKILKEFFKDTIDEYVV